MYLGDKMNLRIEKCQINDKDFIIYANQKIDEASYIEKSELSKNIVKDLFEDEKCVCLIAKDKEKPVGMVLFSKVYWADRGQGVYISQAFVEPAYRKNGIMKTLFQRALEYFDGTNFFTCLVSKRNLAMLSCMQRLHCEDEGMSTFVVNKDDVKF